MPPAPDDGEKSMKMQKLMVGIVLLVFCLGNAASVQFMKDVLGE